MGMPKDQADAIEAGGSVETVIDGDSMTSTVTMPEDATPPASRTQQPDFEPASAMSPSESATAAGDQYEEDGERALTLPAEVASEAQSLFEKYVKKLREKEAKSE